MDESILERVASGDQSAVAECLQRYGGLIWSLARMYCTCNAEMEDAVQEVFIELWRHAPRYDRTVAAESTFITTIARRRLIDRRRRQRQEQICVPLDTVPEQPAPTLAAHLEIQEEVEQVRHCLNRLRAEERQVLQLALCEGLTQERIAQETAMPIGTVKSHARRGLLRLRQWLGVSSYQTSQEGGGM